jgi:hypothetical protein
MMMASWQGTGKPAVSGGLGMGEKAGYSFTEMLWLGFLYILSVGGLWRWFG